MRRSLLLALGLVLLAAAQEDEYGGYGGGDYPDDDMGGMGGMGGDEGEMGGGMGVA